MRKEINGYFSSCILKFPSVDNVPPDHQPNVFSGAKFARKTFCLKMRGKNGNTYLSREFNKAHMPLVLVGNC